MVALVIFMVVVVGVLRLWRVVELPV